MCGVTHLSRQSSRCTKCLKEQAVTQLGDYQHFLPLQNFCIIIIKGSVSYSHSVRVTRNESAVSLLESG